VLHRVVRAHWPAFLERAEEAGGLPRFVVREVEAYLECGLLAHGLVHLQCRDCGEELVVALSCKRRGFCPSCVARRMPDAAAHLVDDVLPEVPTRQWVCSLPWRLRILFGYDRRLCAEVMSAFTGAVSRSLARSAGAGCGSSRSPRSPTTCRAFSTSAATRERRRERRPTPSRERPRTGSCGSCSAERREHQERSSCAQRGQGDVRTYAESARSSHVEERPAEQQRRRDRVPGHARVRFSGAWSTLEHDWSTTEWAIGWAIRDHGTHLPPSADGRVDAGRGHPRESHKSV